MTVKFFVHPERPQRLADNGNIRYQVRTFWRDNEISMQSSCSKTKDTHKPSKQMPPGTRLFHSNHEFDSWLKHDSPLRLGRSGPQLSLHTRDTRRWTARNAQSFPTTQWHHLNTFIYTPFLINLFLVQQRSIVTLEIFRKNDRLSSGLVWNNEKRAHGKERKRQS